MWKWDRRVDGRARKKNHRDVKSTLPRDSLAVADLESGATGAPPPKKKKKKKKEKKKKKKDWINCVFSYPILYQHA